MGKIYTMVNQKGGVGKTTSAISIAANLAEFGYKVLLIDLDAQANATSSLGVDKNAIQKGTYEVLLGIEPIGPRIMHNKEYNISLLPSSPALAGAEVELIDMKNREKRLRIAIQSVIDHYDYILIDCPPSLSLLTINGLVASKDGVLIPVQCEYLALEGLSQLAQTLNRVRKTIFPELNTRGVILTMYDGRTKLAQEVVHEVRRHFPDKVFETIIPRNIRLAECPSYGEPITKYAPESLGAKAYASLTKEILQEDGFSVK